MDVDQTETSRQSSRASTPVSVGIQDQAPDVRFLDGSDEGYSEIVSEGDTLEGHRYINVFGTFRNSPSPDLVKSPSPALYSNDYGTIEEEREETHPEEEAPNFKCCCCFPLWLRNELYEVLQLSGSLILLTIFNYMIAPVALAFVGHLGTEKLGGVSLACTIFNVTGISIGIGLCSTCGTFFTQAYGSVNKRQVGVYLIRGIIIVFLFIFPCIGIQLNTELILVAMGQERELARIAGEYMKWFMPALPGVFLSEILFQYLRCQNVIVPTVIIAALSIGFDALLHYILLFVYDFGIIGSALTQVATFYFMAIQTIIYIFVTGLYKETWCGWTSEIFYDWGQFFWLALAGMLMLAMEWWSFEVGTVLAGLLGPIPLAAQAIGFQIISFAFMLPLGVGIACTIRVGQLLGGENPLQASRSAKIGIVLIVVSGLTMSAILASLSSVIPRIFTEDEEVIEYARKVILMIALFEFFDSVQGVCAGIIRGCGRQVLGAVTVFIGYYIIGLPIGFSLMFLTELEVIGLYIGLTAGLVFCAAVLVTVVFRTDWEEEMRRAMQVAGTADMNPTEKVIKSAGAGYVSETDVTSDGEYTSASEPASGTEHVPLLGRRRRIRRTRRRSYSASSCHSSMVNLPTTEAAAAMHAPTNSKMDKDVLIRNRVVLILVMVMLFFVGLFVRLTIELPTEGTRICIPANSSLSFNVTGNATYPICPNATVIQ